MWKWSNKQLRMSILLVALWLVLQGRCFSESVSQPPATWTTESVKDWLYTITPDQLVEQLVTYKNLQQEIPLVEFPTVSFFLSKEGTLVSRWDTPMDVKVADTLEYKITMDQIEVPNFVTVEKVKVPWGWITAGGLALFVGGLVTGILAP